MMERVQDAMLKQRELQDLVFGEDEGLHALQARCNALQADNQKLRGQLGNWTFNNLHGEEAVSTAEYCPPPGEPALSTPKAVTVSTPQAPPTPPLTSPMSNPETNRAQEQVQALRKVLQQKEEEVTKERALAAQLRTGIKAAQSEYASNMKRLRRELGVLEKDRTMHEERVKALHKQLDEALNRADTDSKAASRLRAFSQSLSNDIERLESDLRQERQQSARRQTMPDQQQSPKSPDQAVKKAKLPDSVPPLRLHLLSSSNFAANPSSDTNKVDAVETAPSTARSLCSARSIDSARSISCDDFESMSKRASELEARLKKEKHARLADQRAMMEHLKAAGLEKLRMSAELAQQTKTCSSLESELMEMRIALRRRDSFPVNTGADESQQLSPQPQEPQQHETPKDLFASFLALWDLPSQSKLSKVKLDSPRGDRAPETHRSTGQPFTHPHQEGHSSSELLHVHNSPTVSFPLETITEGSTAGDDKSPRNAQLRMRGRMMALGGGTHTSLKSSSPTSHALGYSTVVDLDSLDSVDLRVTL